MSHQQIEPNMEALVWRGARDMVLQAESTPRPGLDEVLLAVDAVGICGSELSGYLGHNSLRRPPLVMGHEAAGRIVAHTDSDLADGSSPQLGMRVTFNPLVVCGACDRCQAGRTNLCRRRQLVGAHRPGAFAGYVAVPARQCWPLPDHLSDVAGALTEPLACAVRAVGLAQVAPDSRLLIHGAGPIGLCCLAVARAAGTEHVCVSDLAPRRLEVARRWGAHDIIDAGERDVVALAHEIAAGGFEAVIDAVGASSTRTQAVQAVVPGGRVVFIGLHHEESPLAANYLVRQEVTIQGSFAYTDADWEQALDLLSRGVIGSDGDWLELRPLAAGPAAFEELIAGSATTKIILTVPWEK